MYWLGTKITFAIVIYTRPLMIKEILMNKQALHMLIYEICEYVTDITQQKKRIPFLSPLEFFNMAHRTCVKTCQWRSKWSDKIALRQWSQLTRLWVNEQGQHWFRKCLVSWPSHYLNQLWKLANWAHIQWNMNKIQPFHPMKICLLSAEWQPFSSDLNGLTHQGRM